MASIAQAKLAIDSNREYRKIQKQAAKKSLWGSIGRTIGGLAATVLTGGTAGPLVAGMMAAGGTFLGGAIGSNQARISGGKFHKGEREDLRDKLGPLGEANVVAALQSGITAGMMQSAKIAKDVSAASEPKQHGFYNRLVFDSINHLYYTDPNNSYKSSDNQFLEQQHRELLSDVQVLSIPSGISVYISSYV